MVKIILLTFILIPASFVAGGALSIALNRGVHITYQSNNPAWKIGNAPVKRVVKHNPMEFSNYLKKLRRKAKK